MLSIIASVTLLCVIGVFLYFNLRSHGSSQPVQLTASEQAALQVSFPQETTNLQTDGLIQFTMVLQASDKKAKDEVTQLTPDIQDTVNRIMLQFTSDQLKQVSGFDKLKQMILQNVNQRLQHGQVTKVDFSQIVIQ